MGKKCISAHEHTGNRIDLMLFQVDIGIHPRKLQMAPVILTEAEEAQKKRLEEQMKELVETVDRDDVITFEELGIDSIMVDEAHAFKRLLLLTFL